MLLLFLAAVAIFLPSLHYEMLNWDDEYYVLSNPWLLNFSWGNITGLFTHSYFSNYHPLTMISYMVDFQLWGYEPAGYRAVNLVLHGATVVIGYLLLRALGGARWLSFFLMLFFAVHPLRLESVVWISERKDVLAGLFYTLALLFWVKGSRTTESHHSRAWITAAVVAVVLSLFSKAMAVSFPFVVFLHDMLLHRDRVKPRVPVYLLLVALSVLFMWANMQAQTEARADWVPLSWRIKVAAFAPVHYGWKTLLPVGLSPLYPFELRPTQHWWAVVLAVVVNLIALAAVILCWKRRPLVAWGLLSAAIVLGPVSGIITFGAAWAADRYSYLPTLVLLAGLAPWASNAKPRSIASTRPSRTKKPPRPLKLHNGSHNASTTRPPPANWW
jgi:hypothetical protein